MNDDQKKAIHALLELSYEQGFCHYPYEMIIERAGLPPDTVLYDWSEQSGLLWEFDFRSGNISAGLLDFMSGAVAITMDAKDELERWVNFSW